MLDGLRQSLVRYFLGRVGGGAASGSDILLRLPPRSPVRCLHEISARQPGSRAVMTTAPQLNTYLSFNGNCEAAFQAYVRCFGGTVGELFRYGGSPMADQVPPDWAD